MAEVLSQIMNGHLVVIVVAQHGWDLPSVLWNMYHYISGYSDLGFMFNSEGLLS